MNISKKRLLLIAGLSITTAAIVPSAVSAHSYDYNGHDAAGQGHYQHWYDGYGYGTESSVAQADGTVVDVLSQDGRFTTLVAAVQAAGLTDALNSADQKTVFAPTDEAFAKLPAGTVEALLADPAKLADILKNHVVAGAVDSETAIEVGEATTLYGQMVDIGEGDDGNVYVNDSVLEETDLMAENGIVHVVDAVILPKM